MKCEKDGSPGWKYGQSGTCYTYTAGDDASEKRAKKKAVKQAVAVGGGKAPADLSDRDLADAGIVRTRALTKWCRICEKVKPEAKFRADGRTSDGLATICDGCRESETALSAAEPATVDIPNVELLSTGGPYFGQGSPPEGDFFTEEDLDELAAAYAALHDEVRIPVKVGHGRKQTLLKNSGLVVPPDADVAADELPAAGWVENVRRDGGKLLGDLRKVPRKLADLMKLDAFRTRSIELSRVTSQTLGGREFPNVLTGLAVLGAKAPAVRTLDDILAWYAEAHPDVELVPAASLLLADEEPDDAELRTYASGDVVWSAEDGCNDWMDDLVETLNGDGGDSYGPDGMWIPPRYSILDLDQVNRRALVSDRDVDDDYCWIVPFTLDAQGDPEPASDDEWTLASRAWIEAGPPTDATELSEAVARLSRIGLVSGDGVLRLLADHFGVSLDEGAGGADTRPMSLLAQFNDQQIAAFAGAAGIDESDPTALREAVARAFGIEETTDQPPTPTPPAPPAPPTPTPPDGGDGSTAQLPPEVVTELAEARTERERNRIARREASLRVALSQSRIDPGSLDGPTGWRAFFDSNEELAMTQLLAQPPNLARAVVYGRDESGDQEAATQFDAAYASFAAATGVRPVSLAPNGGQS